MRSTIVISLLILFIFSHAGYYCVYSFQQNQIKKEVRENFKKQLPESSLEIIIAENYAEAIIWQEEGKEFILNGEIYDVAKTKTVNGKTLLYCLTDNKEDKLLREFAKAIKSTTDNSTNKEAKNSFKFLGIDYFLTELSDKNSALNFSISASYSGFISPLSYSVKEIIAPPPRA